jgi:hypothetical protein
VAVGGGSESSLTIAGAGPTATTVRTADTVTVITLGSPFPVTLQGMTITGTSNPSSADGAGIEHEESQLTLADAVVSDNTGEFGGGLGNYAPATVSDVTFSGDSASNGGGIYNSGAVLVLTDDTFVGDSATGGGAGGGVTNVNNSASLTATNTTFFDDTAGYGGALYDFAPAVHLVGDTFADNQAPTGTGGGGAINIGFPATAADVTVAGSLFAGNTSGTCVNTNTGGAPVTDLGYNVADDASCGFGAHSLSNSTTIGALTLAANGSTGPETAAITSSSSAYGEVPGASCVLTTDERGQPRPGIGSSCDAGAFELQPPPGYDLAGSDGGVFVFPTGQSSGFYGSLPALGVSVHNVVGMVPTNDYHGYDLVGSDGGVFVFPTGSSGYYGSLPALGVSVHNVVGIVPTNDDQGYDLVGSDGGVFVFPTGQSSGFYGSLPGLGVHTNDIVGIVATPGGGGYFLVGRDGGVFTFGNAPYLGSLPGEGTVVSDVAGIASTPSGKGYYVVGANGAVYPFGDAASFGSLPASGIAATDIVSIVPTPDAGGYWLIGANGAVYPFGDAPNQGSLPGLGVSVNDVVGAVPTA